MTLKKINECIIPFLFLQVTSQGQIIGTIVAVNQIVAQAAARMVEIEYEDLKPVIISIEVFFTNIKSNIKIKNTVRLINYFILLFIELN